MQNENTLEELINTRCMFTRRPEFLRPLSEIMYHISIVIHAGNIEPDHIDTLPSIPEEQSEDIPEEQAPLTIDDKLKVLNRHLEFIIEDSSYYPDMTIPCALDCVAELSELSTIFVNNPKYEDVYRAVQRSLRELTAFIMRSA